MNGQISFAAALILVAYTFVIGGLCLVIFTSIVHAAIAQKESLQAMMPGLISGALAMMGLFLWLRHCDSRS